MACHGIKPGAPRPPSLATWKTPIMDVGANTREWDVLLRRIKTGSLEGALIPGAVAPLRSSDLALNALKVAVVGAIIDYQAAAARPSASATTFQPSVTTRNKGPTWSPLCRRSRMPKWTAP